MSKSWPSRDIRCSVSVGKATLKGREAWVPVTTAFDGRGRHSEQTQEWVFVCQQSHWRLDVEQNMQRFADEAKEGFEKLRQDLGYEAEE